MGNIWGIMNQHESHSTSGIPRKLITEELDAQGNFGPPILWKSYEKLWSVKMPHYPWILLIDQTVTWGTWLSNTLGNTDYHSATRKNKTSQFDCLPQSQCERLFSVWTTHLSVVAWSPKLFIFEIVCRLLPLPVRGWMSHWQRPM